MTSIQSAILLQRLQKEIAENVDEFLSSDSMAYVTATRLQQDIVEHGTIMAYREEVRTKAIDAFLHMDEIALTDLAAVAALQRAVTAYLSVERFIQAHLGLLDRLDNQDALLPTEETDLGVVIGGENSDGDEPDF